MSRKNFFSLHNQLPARDDPWQSFELNPAAVEDGGSYALALSILCLGPPLGTDRPLELTLVCDGEPTELSATEQRSEELDDGSILTVGLFDASRDLLEAVTCGVAVEMRLVGSAASVERELSTPNRSNLVSFLDHLQLETSPPSELSIATAAG